MHVRFPEVVVKPIHAIVVSALLKLIPKEWYHSFCLCFTTHKILQFGFAEPNPQHVHSPAIPGPLWTFALPQGLKDLSRNTSHCEQRGVASSCNCEVEARGKAKLEQTNLPLQFEVGKESIYSWRDDNDNCFSGPELGYTIYILYKENKVWDFHERSLNKEIQHTVVAKHTHSIPLLQCKTHGFVWK